LAWLVHFVCFSRFRIFFVFFCYHAGEQESRYFVNAASAGLGGVVIQTMARLPAFLPGPVRYNLASIIAMASYAPPAITLAFDGAEAEDARLLLLVLANGRWIGGGMRIAPDAEIDDGLLDMVGLKPASLPRLLAKFPQVYAGTHFEIPEFEHGRGSRLVVGGDTPMPLEIDGEQPGNTPATFQSIPQALKVLVPAHTG